MVPTNSLQPLSSEELQEAEQLSQGSSPDAGIYQELDQQAYEDLASKITQSEKALAACREIALTQGKVLVFQRDLLMQEIEKASE